MFTKRFYGICLAVAALALLLLLPTVYAGDSSKTASDLVESDSSKGDHDSHLVQEAKHLLAKHPEELTYSDFENFSELVRRYKESGISVEDAETFLNQLDEKQLRLARQAYAARAGISIDEWEKEIYGNRPAIFQGDTLHSSWNSPSTPWGWGSYASRTGYWRDDNCDSYPSDEDWLFHYTGVNVTSSTVRWNSISPDVIAAFNLAYGGRLSAFGYYSGEARLCIGGTTLFILGFPAGTWWGAWEVARTVYVGPR